MALLVRIARQNELKEGGKIVKEAHGRSILLARVGGKVYATDAHCFHMGGNLWEGDIEDVGGHACIKCPLHSYKIDMSTGQKVDTDLTGCVTCTPSQQQRTYTVYPDPDFIRIDIPELHSQKALPSDRYNQVSRPAGLAPPQGGGFGLAGPSTAGTPGRGLFGSSTGGGGAGGFGMAPEPLAPYAGSYRAPLVPGPGTPQKEAADEPALVLSQEAPQPSPVPQQQTQPFQPQFQQPQGQIPFPQSRMDSARIARRKAATAAIAARAYMPPSAPAAAGPARGLFTSGTAPQQQQQAGGQQTLFNFGFSRSPAVSAAPDDMDMS